jgi:putative alpha-1,2-mannosidase
MPGLIALMGGPEAFAARLDESFRKAEPNGFRTPHGHHARGWVEFGNQPSGAMAHLFNHAGAPWRSQYWVRRVHQEMFASPEPDGGYHGDDDQGQLAALSALITLGLFDVQGGVGENPDWELTAPIFNEARIAHPGRPPLIIRTTRTAAADCYLQSVRFRGRPLHGCFLPARDLAQGGLLEITLGPEPNRVFLIK